MPRVLVLSGQRTVQLLKDLTDFEVVFAEQDMTLEQVLLADYPLECDLGDWDTVIALAERAHQAKPIDAVVTGVERLVPLAGRIRGRLGLPHGVTEEAARTCIDKEATLRHLEAAGISVPQHRTAASPDEAVQAADALSLPVVVKPRDASSAAGLRYCGTEDDVRSAAAAILEDGRDSLLIEEYLTGSEVGVFAARVNGRTQVLWVVQAQVGPPPTFVKVAGSFPSGLSPEQHRELETLVDRALAAVGLDDWVASLQFMLTSQGWRAGEINPRVPGGQAVEMILSTTGYEPSLVAAHAAMGRTTDPQPPRAAHGLYRSIVFDRAGRIDYSPLPSGQLVEGMESVQPPVIEFDVKPGDAVLEVGHPRGGAFGRIVLSGDSPDQLERDLALLLAHLDIRVIDDATAADEVDRPHTSCC